MKTGRHNPFIMGDGDRSQRPSTGKQSWRWNPARNGSSSTAEEWTRDDSVTWRREDIRLHGGQYESTSFGYNLPLHHQEDAWMDAGAETSNSQSMPIGFRIWFYLSWIDRCFQYESLITKGNEGLVHHIEIFYCDAPKDHQVEKYDGLCSEKPNSALVCSKVRAAWAMGATPFYYPEEAGLSIGGPGSNPTFMMEIHYNNPAMKSGLC